jgi:ribosomal protein S18 acetylase RimI-like enzyme
VLDGLAWLERRGVERAVVNTQLENRKALALYESLGFRREPRGLSVLSAGVRP